MSPAPDPPAFDTLTWRVGDALVSVLARLGIGPMHLLTTRGRTTGRPHEKPVVPIEHDGALWLVAPYGPVGWVQNVRADGRVTLRHGRDRRQGSVREVTAEEAAPVLKAYVGVATKTRSCFRATKDSPVDDFVAEAPSHPVFVFTPTTRG
jgi:deazaflavin-dependent oxidoreductase (nitroreductase family)